MKGNDIDALLHQVFDGKWLDKGYYIGISDQQYYLPTLEEFRTYVYHNRINIAANNPIAGTEGFDCDDFSFILKGHVSLYNRQVTQKPHSWAVGIIWGMFSWTPESHATNFVITSDKKLLLYEPQQYMDGFYNPDKCLGNVKLIIL